uniref:Hydroxysteroid 17-beta dehydrogenase 8 n=1 Tax=Aquila chrysaetos chrysaetos TaxID=223781 RepID=A0A663FBY3_AQUCH
MSSAGRLGGALALVTGGASGIGRAVCARLAREGARLAVADLDEGGARDTVGGLCGGGGGPPPTPPHAAFGVDVASATSVTELLARVQVTPPPPPPPPKKKVGSWDGPPYPRPPPPLQDHFGVPPRVCVGCAGVTRDEFLLRLGEGAFREVLGVNLTGTFLVTQAVGPGAGGHGGSRRLHHPRGQHRGQGGQPGPGQLRGFQSRGGGADPELRQGTGQVGDMGHGGGGTWGRGGGAHDTLTPTCVMCRPPPQVRDPVQRGAAGVYCHPHDGQGAPQGAGEGN